MSEWFNIPDGIRNKPVPFVLSAPKVKAACDDAVLFEVISPVLFCVTDNEAEFVDVVAVPEASLSLEDTDGNPVAETKKLIS